MRKAILTGVLATLGLVATGCASYMPGGWAYTDLKLPVTATANTAGAKKGVSECKSYFMIIATGDASVATAMRNGGITKVSHVDWEANNILGIVGTYRCIVYGD